MHPIMRINVTLFSSVCLTNRLNLTRQRVMSSGLKPVSLSKSIQSFLTETRRYAGHSKWANIRHTKAEKDFERHLLFSSLRQKMRVAIAEVGSADPKKNLRLAQAIVQAKKSNMPAASIQSVLEKAQSNEQNTRLLTFEVRGAGGCILLVHCNSNNHTRQKMIISPVLKKFGGTFVESSVRCLFDHKGVITTEGHSDLDKATDDAITAEAEDVVEFENQGKKYFKFTCDPSLLPKVKSKLEGLKYVVISSEEDFTANTLVEITEQDMEAVQKLCEKLLAVENVYRIDDNIA